MANVENELLRIEVRCDPGAPAAVRGLMAPLRGLGWVLGDAMLVASELVSVAVRRVGWRTDAWLTVVVSRGPDALAIMVAEPLSSAITHNGDGPSAVNPDELGMLVIDELTSRWGDDGEAGSLLWAEIPLAGTR